LLVIGTGTRDDSLQHAIDRLSPVDHMIDRMVADRQKASLRSRKQAPGFVGFAEKMFGGRDEKRSRGSVKRIARSNHYVTGC